MTGGFILLLYNIALISGVFLMEKKYINNDMSNQPNALSLSTYVKYIDPPIAQSQSQS